MTLLRAIAQRGHGVPRMLGNPPMGSPTLDYGGAESGAEAGGATGAEIGTDVPLPVIGTVSGAAIGAVIGAIVGGLGFTGGSANVQFEQCCLPDQKACIYYSAYDGDPNLCQTCPGWDSTWTATTLGTDKAIPDCLRDILLPGLTTLTLPSLAVLLEQRAPDFANSHVPYQAQDTASGALNSMPYPAWPEWSQPSDFTAGNVQNAMMSYWLDAYEQLIALGIVTGVRSPNEVANGAPYAYPFPVALGTRVNGSIDTSVGPSSPQVVSSYNVPKTVGPLLTEEQFNTAQTKIAAGQGPNLSVFSVDGMNNLKGALPGLSPAGALDPSSTSAAPSSRTGYWVFAGCTLAALGIAGKMAFDHFKKRK